MLARWPGVTPAGATCDVPVIVEDFLPTIASLAGVGPVEQVGGELDGLDVTPLLRDPSARPAAFERDLIWHQPNNWRGGSDPGYGPHSTIRSGDHKLIHYHAPEHEPRFELFDLAADLSETTNLVDARPDVAMGLAERLQAALIAMGADRMTVRATGEPVPWPADALRARGER